MSTETIEQEAVVTATPSTKFKEPIFTFDHLEELVDRYFEESEEASNAAITYEGGFLTLTTITFNDASVVVYRAPENPQMYVAMDEKYVKILEDDQSFGSDFWDMWTALLHVLEPHKIVEETLNP